MQILISPLLSAITGTVDVFLWHPRFGIPGGKPPAIAGGDSGDPSGVGFRAVASCRCRCLTSDAAPLASPGLDAFPDQLPRQSSCSTSCTLSLSLFPGPSLAPAAADARLIDVRVISLKLDYIPMVSILGAPMEDEIIVKV